jgi:YHS domain-containing protein
MRPEPMIAKRLACTIFAAVVLLVAADGPQPGRRADQEALKPFAGLVGDWRGTGQPQRGSAKGAWTETGGWAWKLSPDHAALELTVGKGKFLRSATLRRGKGPNAFALDAVLADGAKRTYVGTHAEKKPLALTAEPPDGDGPRRVVLTPLHDTRFLLLFEGAGAEGSGFRKLAEVGYTRQGVAFAAGESGPLCIVTEGRGTTQVSYKGKTYWVCCSGCKDLFNDDPEAVLAEAAAREKAKQK